MAQQWEGLLEGAAQELRGHLTLERVTASKAGDEIAVFFSSDMLVEEKPFLAAQRAIRRNFAPTRVKLIIRSPQLAQDFLNDPQKYAPFILRCVKRRHPSGAPFMNDAKLECKGDVLSVLVPQNIAPKFLTQSGVDHYIEQLIENVFVTKVHVVFQAVKLREEQLEEIRRRRKAEDEQAVAEMIKTQSEQVAAQETKAAKEKPKAVFGRPITAEPLPISELTEEASKLTICGEVLTVETRELRGGEMQLLSFALTDYTNTIKCKAFLRYKPRKGRFGGASQEEDDRPPTEEEKKAVDDVIAAVKEGKTTPPKHFTEDTLLSAMETAGKDDMPEDAERKGLGTPATRAGILEKLVSTGFLERKKSKKTVQLLPSHDAISLITVLPEQLQSPLLTAEWEYRLGEIERGELAPEDFMAEITAMLKELVGTYQVIKGSEYLFAPPREVVGKCPRCGGEIAEMQKGFFCQDKSCKFAIWKNSKWWAAKRKQPTKAIVAALLKDGRAHVTGLYSEKSGKTYDATVVMEDTGQYVNFKLEFDRQKGGGK